MSKTIGEQLDELDSKLADDEISVNEHTALRAELLASAQKSFPKWPFVVAGVIAAVGLVAAGAGIATVMRPPVAAVPAAGPAANDGAADGDVVEGEVVQGQFDTDSDAGGETASGQPVSLKMGEPFTSEFVTITPTETKMFAFEYASDERMQGVLVKTCSNSSLLSESDQIGWAPWSMRDDDDGSYAAGDPLWFGDEAPKPVYPNGKSLREDECAKGWILFESGGREMSEVVYENGYGDSVRWALS